MTLRELVDQLMQLLETHAGAEVQALIDTPNEWRDGEVSGVRVHNTKHRIVLQVDQIEHDEEVEDDED